MSQGSPRKHLFKESPVHKYIPAVLLCRNFNSKFPGFYIQIVMHFHRMIVILLLAMGIVSTGCTTNQNGKKTPDEMNQLNQAGLKEGPWEIYQGSVLISKGSYVNGLPEGLWTSWYKNGQMKEEGHYKEGRKTGMWVEWYEDGEIMWKGVWENGRRQIEHLQNKANVSFIGHELTDHVLAVDSLYHLRIRIQNIPASNLFVEVSSGEIYQEEDSDLFILKTSSDTMFTMAIGYIPDLDFKDFRNLISELEFKLK